MCDPNEQAQSGVDLLTPYIEDIGSISELRGTIMKYKSRFVRHVRVLSTLLKLCCWSPHNFITITMVGQTPDNKELKEAKRRKLMEFDLKGQVFIEDRKAHKQDNTVFKEFEKKASDILRRAREDLDAASADMVKDKDLAVHVPVVVSHWMQTRCDNWPYTASAD